MTKDKSLEELFLSHQPQFNDKANFMASLNKRLDAVEFIKQHQEATIHRYKMSMVVAFVVGVICGIATMAYMFFMPANMSLFTFHVHAGFFLWFTENSQSIIATSLILLMSIGIMSIIDNIQDIIQLREKKINTNMKKQTIITALLALVTLTGQAQTNKYTIHGNFTKVAEAMSKQGLSFDSAALVNPAIVGVVAKQSIQNGKFTIQGTVDKPYYAILNIGISSEVNGETKRKNSRIPIIIEPGDIQFDGNNRVPIIKGSPLNDLLSDVISKRNAPDFIETVKELVILHKDDAVAIPLLLMLDDNMLEPDILLTLIGQLNEDTQHHPHVTKVKEKAEILLTRPKEGDMFKDFAIEDKGKTTHLSDYVGRGKYVLADFWASWCGPCRQEIPKLITLYENYKDKEFLVLGVAAQDKTEDSQKAISEMQIPYPQILNTQKIATDLYGIDALPETILFAPDGTILVRGLRGEEIENKLAEIFGENK
jgi:thiol-disulfide isomerase/thioredoxin